MKLVISYPIVLTTMTCCSFKDSYNVILSYYYYYGNVREKKIS